MSKAALCAVAAVALCASVPASAQNFQLQSAETIDQGNFKLGAYPVLLFGDKDVSDDDTFGVAGRVGYGFTPRFDVEGKVGFFDGFNMYGADAEYWLVRGPLDVSVSGGFHLLDSDVGADSKAADVAGLLSGKIAQGLDLYGGLTVSFESLKDVPDSGFKRVYLTPGIEYRLAKDLDLVAEVGVGLNDDSPNYIAGGLSFYIR